MKISRNAPCFCGSGKKYKRCCWRKERKHNDVVESSRLQRQFSALFSDSDEDVEPYVKEEFFRNRWENQRMPWVVSREASMKMRDDPLRLVRPFLDLASQEVEIETQGTTLFFKNITEKKVQEILGPCYYFPPQVEGEWIRVKLD